MNAPFLTEVDPEIAVKGSIDPLGLLPLWSRYGSQVVGNLSLVASSARGFTTLLLGYHFARRLVDERDLPEACMVEAFLKFEQITAYSRLAAAEDRDAHPGRILGLRRVRNRLTQSQKVPIGSGRDAQILSNQRAYGLWALFSGPTQESGLLVRKSLRLSDDGEAFVRRIVYPRLEQAGLRDARAVLDVLAKRKWFEPRGRDEKLARVLADLHADEFGPEEQEFYLERFACGGPDDPGRRQHQLWDCIRAYNDAQDTWHDAFGMTELQEIIGLAKERGYEDLHDRLWRILRFERVIGPAARVFGYLQDHADARPLDHLAVDLAKTWTSGLGHIEPEAFSAYLEPVEALHKDDGVRRFEELARALHHGDWISVIETVLAQNADVMARRGGGPWIVREGDVLQVRHKQDGADLPEEPAGLLIHPYFLTSVKSVGAQVLGKFVEDEEQEAA